MFCLLSCQQRLFLRLRFFLGGIYRHQLSFLLAYFPVVDLNIIINVMCENHHTYTRAGMQSWQRQPLPEEWRRPRSGNLFWSPLFFWLFTVSISRHARREITSTLILFCTSRTPLKRHIFGIPRIGTVAIVFEL